MENKRELKVVSAYVDRASEYIELNLSNGEQIILENNRYDDNNPIVFEKDERTVRQIFIEQMKIEGRENILDRFWSEQRIIDRIKKITDEAHPIFTFGLERHIDDIISQLLSYEFEDAYDFDKSFWQLLENYQVDDEDQAI